MKKPSAFFPNKRRLVGIVAVFLGVLAVFPSAVVAAGATQTTPINMTVKAGFDGYYKDTLWIPVHVTLANDGPDVTGIINIAAPRFDGSTVDYNRSIELPSGSRKEAYMFVAVEGFVSKITVSFKVGNDAPVQQSARVTQLSASDLLYGVLASSPSAYNILTQVDPINGQGRIAQLNVEDLPPAGVAWHALDALVVSDIDTGTLSPLQKDALQAWVASGGRLIVAGGSNWQKIAAGLADILPLAPSGSQTVTGLTSLGAYAYSDPPGESALVTTGTLQPDSVALVSAADSTPLIAERAVGYGHVDFFTFDPTIAPIKSWPGLDGVFRNLFSTVTEHPGWAGTYRNWYNAGEAVNAIPGIGLPHILQVSAFILGYIIVIGPLNYFLLRRLKRRELAWLTIPGIVILFTVVTYIASFGLRGTQATLHRLSVAQVWENSDRASVETLVGIFSPRRSEYDLQVTGDMLLRPLPSDTYYGSVDTSMNGASVEQGDAALIRNVRVDVGAIKPFIAQGQIAAPSFKSALAYTVAASQPVLKGTITNQSNIALKDAVVLAFSGFERVGDVAPGAQVEVNIPLTSNRATWTLQSQNQILPPSVPVSSALSSGSSSSSGYDSTIENILGTVSYYDDRETYRRYSLLTWLFDPYSSGGRGSGTFLVGWTDQSPVNISLANAGFNTADQTLYIVRLEPKLVVSTGTVTVPPGLMTWETLDPGTGGAGSPYDSYLSQGYFSVRYRPFAGLDYKKVQSLTLHLESYGTSGTAPVTVSVWDQIEGAWVELPNLKWGSTQIKSPENYIAGDGHIDVKVENPSFNSVSLEAVDFTVVVEH